MKSKICFSCKVEKYKNQFSPHKDSKDGLFSYCRECVRALNKIYYENNKEKEKARTKKYRVENPEVAKNTYKKYHSKNQEKERLYRQNNREKISKNCKIWRENNKEKARSIYSRRRANKLQAIPLWANKEKIQKFYKKANELTGLTGVIYEVDHIVPLQNRIVCGLHCESNLQILTRSENRKKGNKFWLNMP